MKKNTKNIKDILKPTLKKPAVFKKVKLPVKKGRKTKASRRQDVKLHQHLLERFKTKKELRLRKRAEYLATLPKGRWNRFLYIMHPKRVIRRIFSYDGLMMGLRIAGVGTLLLVVFMFVVFAYYHKDLPKNITDLKACSQGQKSAYYDRTGEILLWRGEGDVDCQPVAINQMSDFLKKAVIASEDQSFYKHHGFDVKGTVRAALTNARSNDASQGGSTITQQYVKQAVLSDNEKRLSRKIKELILSVELESTYKKDEILQAYLNEVPLGSVYNGAEAASQGFFNKPAKDLTLDEAAILAAGIQAPGTYWTTNQKGLVERKNNYVLENMVQMGYITRAQADAAKKVDTLAKVDKTRNMYKNIKAPHFVLEVQRRLEDELGASNLRRQGYKIITTLDMDKQRMAEQAISDNIGEIEDKSGFDNAALVSEEVATGQVIAYVGSRDFNYPGFGELNVAATPRSPGSSVKPYDYATLMKQSQNWGAGSIFYNWVTQLPGWPANDPLTNYGKDKGAGPSTMRYLLGQSKNIPAVKAAYIAGLKNVHDEMKKMGVTSGFTNCGLDCDTVYSTAIGDGGEVRLDEHVHGMSTFSRMGKYIPQLYVLKILDSKGKVIRDYTKPPVPEEVLDPQIAYIINDMLSDGNASFFRSRNSAARQLVGYQDQTIPTAIKTGTTNNNENGWMMGYTPEYATGSWVGNHENLHTDYANGMHTLNGPIWGEFMRLLYENRDVPAKWAQPDGIKTITMDSTFYNLVKGACHGDATCNYGPTDIYPSWYTARKSSQTESKVVVDTVSGKRATDCTPAAARKEITGGGLIIPEIDSSDPYYKQFLAPISAHFKTASGEAIPAEDEIDDVHNCADVKPTVTLSPITTCTNTCTVTANITKGTHDLANLYFKLDGTTMAGGAFSLSAGATSQSFTITPDFSGSHVLTAQVSDTALYDTTSEAANVNFTAVPFVQSAVSALGANLKFTWDDISASSYTISYSGASSGSFSASCSMGPGSKCTFSYPKASIGASGSGTYTFTINSSGPTRSSNPQSFAL